MTIPPLSGHQFTRPGHKAVTVRAVHSCDGGSAALVEFDRTLNTDGSDPDHGPTSHPIRYPGRTRSLAFVEANLAPVGRR